MTIPSPGPGAGRPVGKPVPSPGPGARKPIPSPGPGAGRQIPSPGPAGAPDLDDPAAPGPDGSQQTRPEQVRAEQARPDRAEQARPDRASSASLPPPPPEIASGTRTRSRPPWSYVYAALGLAALALALAVGALATVGGGGSEQDRKGALEATRERTLALTSYDYRKLDEDFSGVLATSTGSFSQEYAKATADLRASFTAAESVATSQVVAAGLESFESDRAVAVVAVDQQIAAKGAQARVERNRLRMTLVRGKDTWLVEKVERL